MALWAASSLLAAGPVNAQNSVGLGVGVVPEYTGAKDYHAVPVLELSYRRGAFFIDTSEGLPALGLQHDLGQDWQAGVFVGMRLGRDADDHDRLEGLNDIDAHATVGTFLRWRPGPWRITTTLTQALHAGYGTRVQLNGSYAVWDAGRNTVRLGAETTWGSHDDMSRWFGVTSAEAARSEAGLGRYSAGAGFRSATLYANWRYAIAPRWTLSTSVGIRTLLGDARDSPIVERRTSPYGAVGISYRF
jgi:outer membrane protein